MRDDLNVLGQQADRLDNLVEGMAMPLPPQFHLDQIREILPDISGAIKRFVIEQAGVDPWGDQ